MLQLLARSKCSKKPSISCGVKKPHQKLWQPKASSQPKQGINLCGYQTLWHGQLWRATKRHV